MMAVQGLSVCELNKVDLVITDLNMPNMDGIMLIERLRALPAYRFTPILMLTTESQDEKKSAGKRAGATGWVVKPVRSCQGSPRLFTRFVPFKANSSRPCYEYHRDTAPRAPDIFTRGR